ncbi:MAG: hypothetical protein ACFFFT_04145 [Candidatus Thorarchaeota archaeon]
MCSILLLQKTELNNIQENNPNLNRKPLLSGPGSLKTAWYRTWGYTQLDWGLALNIDSLDNIYVLGISLINGSGDPLPCLVKYNSNGELQWNRSWGEEGDYAFNKVIVDSQNNIYVTGHTKNITGDTDAIYLIKFNSSGDLLWNYTWCGDGDSTIAEITLDSMNNIYLVGQIENITDLSDDILLIKFSGLGDLQWNLTWGDSNNQRCSNMAIDSADDIYISGINLNGTRTEEFHIWKFNNTGHLQWSHTLSGIIHPQIAIDSLDNLYILSSNYSIEEMELYLMKYDPTGTQLWNNTWRRTPRVFYMKITIDSSDNIYIGGNVRGNSPDDEWSDIFLVKYNNLGVRLWNQTWDRYNYEEFIDITTDSKNNIYLAGNVVLPITSRSDMVILSYDSSGTLNSYTNWGGYETEVATGIALDSSENIYISGFTESFGAGYYDMCLVKFVENPPEFLIPGYDLMLFILIFTVISIITAGSRFTKIFIKKT